MKQYIKINNLKDGYIYKINARNAEIGVWIEQEKAFMVSRWKFKSNYLFLEYHWDIEVVDEFSSGTVKPIEIVEKFKFKNKVNIREYTEDESNEILAYLDELDSSRDNFERLSYEEIHLNKKSIGVFWIYEKQVFAEFQPIKDIQIINGYKDSDLAHYKVWDKIQNQHPKFYLYEYEEIPRGRVVLDIENDKFIIYCNKPILADETSKELILTKFKLDKSKSLFKIDEHYKLKIF